MANDYSLQNLTQRHALRIREASRRLRQSRGESVDSEEEEIEFHEAQEREREGAVRKSAKESLGQNSEVEPLGRFGQAARKRKSHSMYSL